LIDAAIRPCDVLPAAFAVNPELLRLTPGIAERSSTDGS
jgi:hypothetical protein